MATRKKKQKSHHLFEKGYLRRAIVKITTKAQGENLLGDGKCSAKNLDGARERAVDN